MARDHHSNGFCLHTKLRLIFYNFPLFISSATAPYLPPSTQPISRDNLHQQSSASSSNISSLGYNKRGVGGGTAKESYSWSSRSSSSCSKLSSPDEAAEEDHAKRGLAVTVTSVSVGIINESSGGDDDDHDDRSSNGPGSRKATVFVAERGKKSYY